MLLFSLFSYFGSLVLVALAINDDQAESYDNNSKPIPPPRQSLKSNENQTESHDNNSRSIPPPRQSLKWNENQAESYDDNPKLISSAKQSSDLDNNGTNVVDGGRWKNVLSKLKYPGLVMGISAIAIPLGVIIIKYANRYPNDSIQNINNLTNLEIGTETTDLMWWHSFETISLFVVLFMVIQIGLICAYLLYRKKSLAKMKQTPERLATAKTKKSKITRKSSKRVQTSVSRKQSVVSSKRKSKNKKSNKSTKSHSTSPSPSPSTTTNTSKKQKLILLQALMTENLPPPQELQTDDTSSNGKQTLNDKQISKNSKKNRASLVNQLTELVKDSLPNEQIRQWRFKQKRKQKEK